MVHEGEVIIERLEDVQEERTIFRVDVGDLPIEEAKALFTKMVAEMTQRVYH